MNLRLCVSGYSSPRSPRMPPKVAGHIEADSMRADQNGIGVVVWWVVAVSGASPLLMFTLLINRLPL